MAKSALTPTKRLEHLGVIIDTSPHTLILPREKANVNRMFAAGIIQGGICSLMLLAKFFTLSEFPMLLIVLFLFLLFLLILPSCHFSGLFFTVRLLA